MTSVIFLLIVGVLYFLPSIVAVQRRHSNQAPIFIVNLLTGWTLIGWVIALAWSLSAQKTPPGPPVPQVPQESKVGTSWMQWR